MKTVDVGKELFKEVKLFGKEGYFTEQRVDKQSVPEGMYCYELRYGDDEFPVSVEENVRVNYFGTVLLAEPLELGDEKALQFGYEDFGYTGEQIYLPQTIGKQEPDHFKDGKVFAEFVKETFPMTKEEGQKLVDYMEGHGYLLGHMEGKMFRGDLCAEQDKVHWEPYTVDDAVNAVAEWNYELLKKAEEAILFSEGTGDFTNKKRELDSLREDGKILDGMYDRTKYGQELDALALTLVEELFEDMSREGGIDAAIKKMTDQIRAGEDLLPGVSPALKKNGGKLR